MGVVCFLGSGFTDRDSGLEFRISGYRLRDSAPRIRVPSCRFLESGPGSRILGFDFGFRVSFSVFEFRFRISSLE